MTNPDRNDLNRPRDPEYRPSRSTVTIVLVIAVIIIAFIFLFSTLSEHARVTEPVGTKNNATIVTPTNSSAPANTVTPGKQ